LGIVDADAPPPTSEKLIAAAPSTFTAAALRFCFEACLTRGMIASSVSSCEIAWQACARGSLPGASPDLSSVRAAQAHRSLPSGSTTAFPRWRLPGRPQRGTERPSIRRRIVSRDLVLAHSRHFGGGRLRLANCRVPGYGSQSLGFLWLWPKSLFPGPEELLPPEAMTAVEVNDVDNSSVIAGGVTTANFPQAARNFRRSAEAVSLSGSSMEFSFGLQNAPT
jgi:hypothetical protein